MEDRNRTARTGGSGNGRTILLHCCCGPCATSPVERLLAEGWKVVLYYGNSNIWPLQENESRYGELLKVAARYGLRVVRGVWDHESWRAWVRGLEACPEHGERCRKCFAFNLRETAAAARRLGIGSFTTTLTVSRFKKSLLVFDAGKGLEGFEPIDFKKRNGFGRSVELARELGLARQSYCGCEFSMRPAEEKP